MLFSADYMVCPRNQLCFTNIDDEIDFVSRGCTAKHIFNSIYFFCNSTGCNKQRYPTPADRRRTMNIKLGGSVKRKRRKTSSAIACDTQFSSMFMIISNIIQYISIHLT